MFLSFKFACCSHPTMSTVLNVSIDINNNTAAQIAALDYKSSGTYVQDPSEISSDGASGHVQCYGSSPLTGSFKLEYFGKGSYSCTFSFSGDNKDFNITGGVAGVAYESPVVSIVGRTLHVTLNIYDPARTR